MFSQRANPLGKWRVNGTQDTSSGHQVRFEKCLPRSSRFTPSTYFTGCLVMGHMTSPVTDCRYPSNASIGLDGCANILRIKDTVADLHRSNEACARTDWFYSYSGYLWSKARSARRSKGFSCLEADPMVKMTTQEEESFIIRTWLFKGLWRRIYRFRKQVWNVRDVICFRPKIVYCHSLLRHCFRRLWHGLRNFPPRNGVARAFRRVAIISSKLGNTWLVWKNAKKSHLSKRAFFNWELRGKTDNQHVHTIQKDWQPMIACPPTRLEDLSTVLVMGCKTMKNESRASINEDHWHDSMSNTSLDISFYSPLFVAANIGINSWCTVGTLSFSQVADYCKSITPVFSRFCSRYNDSSRPLQERLGCAVGVVVSLTVNDQSVLHMTKRTGQTVLSHDKSWRSQIEWIEGLTASKVRV